MNEYNNSNGLENGMIPANKPCPFNKGCLVIMTKCPTEDNLLPHKFSCAAARLHSLMIKKFKP